MRKLLTMLAVAAALTCAAQDSVPTPIRYQTSYRFRVEDGCAGHRTVREIDMVSHWGDGTVDTSWRTYYVDTVRRIVYFIDTANRLYGQVQWAWFFVVRQVECGWGNMRVVTSRKPEYYDYRWQPMRKSVIMVMRNPYEQ